MDTMDTIGSAFDAPRRGQKEEVRYLQTDTNGLSQRRHRLWPQPGVRRAPQRRLPLGADRRLELLRVGGCRGESRSSAFSLARHSHLWSAFSSKSWSCFRSRGSCCGRRARCDPHAPSGFAACTAGIRRFPRPRFLGPAGRGPNRRSRTRSNRRVLGGAARRSRYNRKRTNRHRSA